VIPFLKVTIASARRIYCRHENPFERDGMSATFHFRLFWKFKTGELPGSWSFGKWNFIKAAAVKASQEKP
jgi:hypothetical protein